MTNDNDQDFSRAFEEYEDREDFWGAAYALADYLGYKDAMVVFNQSQEIYDQLQVLPFGLDAVVDHTLNTCLIAYKARTDNGFKDLASRFAELSVTGLPQFDA